MGRKGTPHSQAVIQVWSGNVLICCCCCCHFHLECDSGTSKTHFTVLQQCVSKFGDPALCESRHCCEMSLVCLRASRNVDVVVPFWTSTTMHCCFCSWGTLPYSPSSPGPYFCKLNCKHDLDRLLPNTLQATQPPHQYRCSGQVHRFNIQSCFCNGYCKQLSLSTGGTTLMHPTTHRPKLRLQPLWSQIGWGCCSNHSHCLCQRIPLDSIIQAYHWTPLPG